MYVRFAAVLLIFVLAASAARQAVSQQPDPFQRANCQEEFTKLKDELERRGRAIKSASERKAPPAEACKLLRGFTGAEAQMIKFLTEKQSVCGVPDQIIKQSQVGHAKSTATRDQVCKVAATPAAAPPPPSQGLSGALGGSVLGGPPPDSSGGSGIFDTLTGNVLRQ